MESGHSRGTSEALSAAVPADLVGLLIDGHIFAGNASSSP
jgi:hypothetical protein